MMKTDRKYLSHAREIRDKAPGVKKFGQPMTVQSEVVTTSKKRKRHMVSGGPSGSQALKAVPVPSLTLSTIISIIDLEGDTGSSTLVPFCRI